MAKKSFVLTLIFTIAFFTAEIYLWIKYFQGILSFSTLLSIHAIITASCIGVILFFYSMGWGSRFMIIATLLIGLMGPFGAAMALGIMLFYVGYVFFVEPIANLIKMLMPSLKRTKSSELYDRIKYGMETYDISSDPTPLHEVVKFGTVLQKIAALEKMLKYYHPEFIPPLKIALSDPNNSVRVMAATTIAALEDKFHKVYIELERKTEEEPNNPKILLELADHCYRYSQTTIFDEARLSKMRLIAIEKYEKYLTLKPDDSKARKHLGELYFNCEDYNLAKEVMDPLTTSDETFTEEVYILLMRIFYRKKEFDKMRQFTADHFFHLMDLSEKEGYHEFQEVLFSWGGPAAAEKLLEG